MPEQEIDRARFKQDQQRSWDQAAPGWKKWWSTFEAAGQPLSNHLVRLAGIARGARVLDIATGTGEPAMTAARVVGPEGHVIGVDQSAGMLEVARERAHQLGLGNIEFVQADAESLTLDHQSFDAVLCRWGLMFMPDLGATLRRLAGMLRPGGRLAAAVWSTAEKVPMISLGGAEVRRLAKLPPPAPDATGPFRLADTGILESALKAGGYQGVTFERMNVRFEFESVETFVRSRREMSAPFREVLASQPPGIREEILRVVADAAGRHAGTDGVIRLDNESICVAAHT